MLKNTLFLLLLIAQSYVFCMKLELYSPFSKIPEDVTEYIMHKADNIRDVYAFSCTNKEHQTLCNVNNILPRNDYLCSSLSPIQHTLILVKSTQQNNQEMIQKIIETENTVNKINRESILSDFKYNSQSNTPICPILSSIKAYKGLDNQSDTINDNILNHVLTLKYYPLLILIKNNANINKCIFFNQAPLTFAVRLRNKPITELLLKYDCDKDAYDKTGKTALHHACENEEESVTNNEIVQLLLDNKCNINIQNNRKDTPLHIAIREKNFSIAKLLLSHGADITIKNEKNKKALKLTSKKNRKMLKTYMPTNKRKRTDDSVSLEEPPHKKNKK